MRAFVYTHYGSPDLLRLAEIAMPVPRDNEVLVKICAASVNPLDWHVMRGHARMVTGVLAPRHTIPGSDIAGRVEAIGRDVKRFQPGDEVFGGRGVQGGGFAEYVCAVEGELVRKPAGLSFEDAAAVPVAAGTALQGLRDRGHIQAGRKVLVDGSSGGVGTFAVQIAKAFGAEVTAVCNTSNVDTARAIGADHVIDYTQEDFTRGAERYDLIFAASARHSIFDYRRVLCDDGIFVGAGGKVSFAGFVQSMLVGPILSRFGRKKMGGFLARLNQQDLVVLKDLLEAGKIVPVIDRRYPFSQVPDAVRYLEEGHARGKVVITMNG